MEQKECEPHSFPVSKTLTGHVKASRQRYHQSLADNGKLKINRERNEREANIVSEIQYINLKESSLEKAIKELQNNAGKIVFEAEKKNNPSAFCQKPTQKELQSIKKVI